MKSTMPVRALRPLFDRVSAIAGKPTNLNQSRRKMRWLSGWETAYSKGVENEFIRIYHLHGGESYAFAFNGIVSNAPVVTVSHKKSDDEYFTSDFTLAEVKVLLREFAQELEVVGAGATSVEQKDALYKVFKLADSLEEKAALLKKEIEAINKDLDSRRKKVTKAEENEALKTQEYEKKKLQVEDIEKSLRDHLGIADMEAKLDEAKKKVEDGMASEKAELKRVKDQMSRANTASHSARADYDLSRYVLLQKSTPSKVTRRTLAAAIPKLQTYG